MPSRVLANLHIWDKPSPVSFRYVPDTTCRYVGMILKFCDSLQINYCWTTSNVQSAQQLFLPSFCVTDHILCFHQVSTSDMCSIPDTAIQGHTYWSEFIQWSSNIEEETESLVSSLRSPHILIRYLLKHSSTTNYKKLYAYIKDDNSAGRNGSEAVLPVHSSWFFHVSISLLSLYQ